MLQDSLPISLGIVDIIMEMQRFMMLGWVHAPCKALFMKFLVDEKVH